MKWTRAVKLTLLFGGLIAITFAAHVFANRDLLTVTFNVKGIT